LPKVVTRQRSGWELNSQPAGCKSNALATRLPSHLSTVLHSVNSTVRNGGVLFGRKCDRNSVHVARLCPLCAISIAVDNTGRSFIVGVCCFRSCTGAACRPLTLRIATETVAGADAGKTAEASVAVAEASSSSSIALTSSIVVEEISQTEEKTAECLCRNTVTAVQFHCLFRENYEFVLYALCSLCNTS